MKLNFLSSSLGVILKMSFSSEWNSKYLENKHISIWPWSDLISLSAAYLKLNEKSKVLEIGFGMGANIPFFLSKGVEYYGVEGSEAAFNVVSERFPELNQKLILGDFIKKRDYPEVFDMVVDRSSMTHNTSESITQGLSNLRLAMRPGAKFIGVDWFSTEHSDYINGVEVDANTKIFNDNSCFSGLGNVHFSDKNHLIDIFNKAGFDITKLTHKKSYTEVPNDNYVFATWNFVAVRD